MTTTNETGSVGQTVGEREIVVTRVVNAPRDLVFKAFTEREHLVHWWGPNGFSITVHEIDVRTGGKWRFIMHGPDGRDYANFVRFVEVKRPERLVYEHGVLEGEAPHFNAEVTFEALDGKTRVTLHSTFPSGEARDFVVKTHNAIEGGKQTLARLDGYMPASNSEFRITRNFKAPRELVFDAWSDARHLVEWWGPKGFEMGVKKFEFTPGGLFHYSMRAPDGNEIWGRFVYRDIIRPERIAFISSFSDPEGGIGRNPWLPAWPAEVANTLTLTAAAGQTTLTLRGGPINASADEAKAYFDLTKNMEQGFKGTFDKLDDLLAKLSR